MKDKSNFVELVYVFENECEELEGLTVTLDCMYSTEWTNTPIVADVDITGLDRELTATELPLVYKSFDWEKLQKLLEQVLMDEADEYLIEIGSRMHDEMY